jgi:hypothetical protein
MEMQWFRIQNSSRYKVLASAIWEKDRILLLNYPEEGAAISAKHFIAFLGRLEQQLLNCSDAYALVCSL